MKPKVTVLTCVYNGLPHLKDAIESTLNQTYKDFEYLIIDDASPDNNVIKFIESFDDSRIRFVKNEKNLGVANTINKALTLINTPYVVRIDQDDVNLPNRIEEQIDYLEKNKHIDIVCSWEKTIDSQGKKIRNWKRVLDNYGSFLGYILIGICPIWHPSITFKTKVLIDSGGFKADYTRAEDFEVTARLALQRYSAAVVPRFHLLQRQHDDSQSAEFSNIQAATARRVHIEVINNFTSHKHIDMLGKFLRLEKDILNSKMTKANLMKINGAMYELLNQVSVKQKLTEDEFSSLKKVIYKRVGFGIKYADILAHLPSFLFYPAYYALSPFQLNQLRIMASKLYNYLVKLRYLFR